MDHLLKRFIDSFQKAITAEMEAMRRRLGPFEVSLAGGQALDTPAGDDGKFYYSFKVMHSNDKLAPQLECTLVYEGGERLVTITGIDQERCTFRSDRKIGLDYQAYTLVIYPWFLYERLKSALESLLDSDNFDTAKALMLFGKGQPHKQPQPLLAEHPELNTSQTRAVQLCVDSSLAFIWGPPGTGKTTTLGHIVTELLSQGQRILVTSTTNAAVDQALAKLVELPDAQKVFDHGQVVRIGQTDADTFGASLDQVIRQLNAELQQQLEMLRERRQLLRRQIKKCSLLMDKLAADTQPMQLDLFSQATSETITLRDLSLLFSAGYSRTILQLTPVAQQGLLGRRRRRLETAEELAGTKITTLSAQLRYQEKAVVQQARVILSTMTNMYLSSLLNKERFDAVIVEEASMAILPTLFYCAALAGSKVIMVGDPKQLPPIVQSRDAYVYRAMGRNIFDVATANAQIDEFMVMLDTQYRMHPVIGNLVSDLFYDGRLNNGENAFGRSAIARRKPYPEAPVIIVDTQGRTICTTREGSFSRINEQSAQICLDLSIEAIRDGLQSVAIITPYAAQSRFIRQLLSRYRKESQFIECRTVHRFQGGERDLVILDTVDTSPLSPGILLTGSGPGSSSKNLINVSISRARGKLIIIADVAYFNSSAPQSIVNKMLRQAGQAGMQVVL